MNGLIFAMILCFNEPMNEPLELTIMMPCLNETGRLLCQGVAPCLPLACRRHLVVIIRQELPFQKPVCVQVSAASKTCK